MNAERYCISEFWFKKFCFENCDRILYADASILGWPVGKWPESFVIETGVIQVEMLKIGLDGERGATYQSADKLNTAFIFND